MDQELVVRRTKELIRLATYIMRNELDDCSREMILTALTTEFCAVCGRDLYDPKVGHFTCHCQNDE